MKMNTMKTLTLASLVLMFVAVVVALTPMEEDRISDYEASKASIDIDGESFDFVIAGGGPAGIILANRLSALKHRNGNNVTVLLLEAGGTNAYMESYIPLLFSALYDPNLPTSEETDWGYFDNNHQMNVQLPRIRALGGCSLGNTLVQNRGNKEDYDIWETVHGANGWKWNDVLPYFKKWESNFYPTSMPSYHGEDGPMPVGLSYTHEWTWNYQQGVNSTGLPIDADASNGAPRGVARTQTNILDGFRVSNVDAFLTDDVLARPNLLIKLHSHVKKVLFHGKRAIGVEVADLKTCTKVLRTVTRTVIDANMNYVNTTFEREVYDYSTCTNKTVYAAKEVILSAGAYNSPHILQVSGVGQKSLLQSLGIPVVADNPAVGNHLEDHILIGVSKQVDNTVTTVEAAFESEDAINDAFTQFLTFGTGALASNAGEVYTYVKLHNSTLPNAVIEAGPLGFIHDGLVVLPPGVRAISAGPDAMKLKSRGYVKAVSKDPMVKPAINHNYLTVEEDADKIVQGLRIARNFLERSVNPSQIIGEIAPGLNVTTDEQFKQYIRKFMMSGYHPCGTVRMGANNSPLAAVDNELRVKGVKRLRTIDASVIPDHSVANTHSIVNMIAEKGADLIAAEYNLSLTGRRRPSRRDVEKGRDCIKRLRDDSVSKIRQIAKNIKKSFRREH